MISNIIVRTKTRLKYLLSYFMFWKSNSCVYDFHRKYDNLHEPYRFLITIGVTMLLITLHISILSYTDNPYFILLILLVIPLVLSRIKYIDK